jgi:hypothetical protein
MKIETMKIKSKQSKKYGLAFLLSKGNFFIELGFGKTVFLIGLF